MINLQDIEGEIRALPPFKETVLRAQNLLRHPNSSANELAGILQYDAGITTNILKLCNSAYYGLPVEITNLKQAIAYVGQTELRNVLMISGSMSYFVGQQSAYEGNYGELWRHSLATAVCAKTLGWYLEIRDDALFSAALMHDIGKLILSNYVAEEYKTILSMVHDTKVPFHIAERRTLGLTHSEVGAAVLKHWSFPKTFVNVAARHHEADPKKDGDLLLIVSLADIMAGQMGTGTLYDAMDYDGYDDLCEHFRMTYKDVERVMAKAGTEIQKVIYSYAFTKKNVRGNSNGL